MPTHHRYELYLRAGNSGFTFRNRNRGVTLTDQRIEWSVDGSSDDAAFSSMTAIHLESGGAWQNAMRQCMIRFADGYLLIVSDGNEYGSADGAQTPVYRDFVRDLHAWLAASGPRTIRFTAGYSGARYYVIMLCAIALGLIGVALPLATLAITGEIRLLGIAAAGGALCWPLARMLQNNALRDYDPERLPEEVLA